MSIEGIPKGYLFRKGFRKKWYVKAKGLDLAAEVDLHRTALRRGGASPYKHLLSTSPGGSTFSRFVVYLFSRHLGSSVRFFFHDCGMVFFFAMFIHIPLSQPSAPLLFALPAVVRL